MDQTRIWLVLEVNFRVTALRLTFVQVYSDGYYCTPYSTATHHLPDDFLQILQPLRGPTSRLRVLP